MQVSLRPATRADSECLFAWRNDDQTRKGSRVTTRVAWQDHLNWLEASLTSPSRRLLIAESEDGEPVGTVRWDRHGPDEWELSWTVAPHARGRGIGTAIVREAIRNAPGTDVFADVRVENAASIKIAEKAGFTLISEHAGIRRFSLRRA